jgi:hypothetical protein
MKLLLVALTAALFSVPALAKPDDPPSARGLPPPQVAKALPKLQGADKPPVSVQGRAHAHAPGQGQGKGQGAGPGPAVTPAPASVLKFNPPKQ